MRINLGCGHDVRVGWFNCDSNPCDDRVKYIDLDDLPLPFKDSVASEIFIGEVLEHVLYPLELCLECKRVLKPGGKLVVTMPLYSFTLPHRRPVNTFGSLDCIHQNTPVMRYSGNAGFKLVSRKGTRPCGIGLVHFLLFRVMQCIRDVFHRLLYSKCVWEFVKR